MILLKLLLVFILIAIVAFIGAAIDVYLENRNIHKTANIYFLMGWFDCLIVNNILF